MLPSDVISDVCRYLTRDFIENNLRRVSKRFNSAIRRCVSVYPRRSILRIHCTIDEIRHEIKFQVNKGSPVVHMYDNVLYYQMPKYVMANYICLELLNADNVDDTIRFIELVLCVIDRATSSSTFFDFKMAGPARNFLRHPRAVDMVHRILESSNSKHLLLSVEDIFVYFAFPMVNKSSTLHIVAHETTSNELHDFFLAQLVADWIHQPYDGENLCDSELFTFKKDKHFDQLQTPGKRFFFQIDHSSPFEINEHFADVLVKRFKTDNEQHNYEAAIQMPNGKLEKHTAIYSKDETSERLIHSYTRSSKRWKIFPIFYVRRGLTNRE